jgi:hypothetical protein
LSLSLILVVGLQVAAQDRPRAETLIVAIGGQIADPPT